MAATLTIDLGAIADNWRTLAALHAPGATAAVVKADAYGLGAAHVAPALHRAGCRHFFTAHLEEALAIRDLLPGAMLAAFHGLADEDPAAFAAYDVAPVLGSLAEIDAWSAEARKLGRRLAALLHVDTGMNRLGLSAAELATLQADHARLDGTPLLFVMTHLVSAELSADPVNAEQLARFAAACDGLPPAPRSLANSSGVFLPAPSDLARPGAALYGVNPTPGRPNPMRDVVRLSAPVLSVREIGAGESVGYNATWRAARPSRIATVAVGYADGWLRAQSGRGAASFDGMAVPLVGRVSMDLTTYDVTDHPAVRPGSTLDLLGPLCPPDEAGRAAGTSGYEILTALGRRYARRHIGE